MVKQKLGIIFGMIVLFALCAVPLALGQEAGRKVKSSTKELTGKISGISADFISIVYWTDEHKGVEYELMLPIDKSVNIVHKRSIKELNVGDMVTILFEDEVTQSPIEGQRAKRKARQISFVRSAEKVPQPQGRPEPGDGLPDDIQFQR